MTDWDQMATGPKAGTDFERDQWGRPVVDGVTCQRASSVVKVLEDEFNLEKWHRRNVAYGMATDTSLVARLLAVSGSPSEWDRDTKTAVDGIVEAANVAAKAHARADLGTALHAMMERLDRGEQFNAGQFEPDLLAYQEAMQRAGITVLPEFIESKFVNFDLAVAGTCDNLVAYAGEIHAADKKTGSTVDFGHLEHPAQLAAYAGGVRWNCATGKRLETPTINQDTGFIIHVPAGEGRCEIWAANLAEGRTAIELAAQVREIRKASKSWMIPFDKFAGLVDPLDEMSKAELLDRANGDYDLGVPKSWSKPKILAAIREHEADAAEPVVTIPSDAVDPVTGDEHPHAGCTVNTETGECVTPAVDRDDLRRRIETIQQNAEAIADLTARWPLPVGLTDATDDDLPAIVKAVELTEAKFGLPFDPPPSTPQTIVEPAPQPDPPKPLDEGDDAPTDDVEHVRAAWGLLERPAAEWVAALAGRAGNLSMTERPSVRRLLIGWSIVRLGVAGWHDDELLLACVDHAHAIDRDPVGDIAELLARMEPAAAKRLSATVTELVEGRLKFEPDASRVGAPMRLAAAA